MKRFDLVGDYDLVHIGEAQEGDYVQFTDVEKLQKAYWAACALIDNKDALEHKALWADFERLRKEMEE